MFTGPIFSNPIFSTSELNINDVYITVEITIENEISTDLIVHCGGLKCINFSDQCARWKYKKGISSNDKAYVAAITVCDLKPYVYRNYIQKK